MIFKDGKIQQSTDNTLINYLKNYYVYTVEKKILNLIFNNFFHQIFQRE